MKIKGKRNRISALLNLAERRILTRALIYCDGSVAKAAKFLGINRTDLYRRLRRTGIQEHRAEWGNAYWQALGKESKEELKLIAKNPHLTNARVTASL